MDDQNARKSTLGWPGIILLAVVASNLFWLHSPLKSARPKEESRFETKALGDQTAEARLWQDPFEAVSLQRGKNLTGDPSRVAGADLNGIGAQIRRRLGQGRKLEFLPVMVTGIPYTEGAEWRVRTRYAILAGLDRAGYVTEDRSHVGFFEVDWPLSSELRKTNVLAALECTSRGGLKLTVPFEWLERYHSNSSPQPDGGHDYVLVLWLEEEKFEDAPLTRLALLIHGLRRAVATERAALPIPVKIIGPYGSTTLRAMARGELAEQLVFADEQTVSVKDVLQAVAIYSATATAADWRIDPSLLDTAKPLTLYPTSEVRARIRASLSAKAPGLSFTNVTCTDDQLAWELAGELMRRGVNLTNAETRVALISEWDTFYGRALPQSFTNAIFHLAGGGPSNAVAGVWRFSYLRGLDGTLAGGGKSAESPTSATARPPESGDLGLAPLERPEGNSQLDYIPRLANTLKALEGESRRGQTNSLAQWHRAGSMQAIGLLGSDVYDKLLLLQSLRERFPEAIFFTTDLDARLAHSSALKWSRNLIVASSFGLELNRQWQGGIPPFRDNYQTAQFLATLVAMEVYTHDPATALAPRLFEIGRPGPYDLSVAKDNAALHPPRLNEYAGSQPPGSMENPEAFLRENIQRGLALAGMVLLVLVLVSPAVRAVLCWPCPNLNPGRLLLMLVMTAFVVLPGLDTLEWRLGIAGLTVAIWSGIWAAEGTERKWGVAGTVAIWAGALLLCLYCRIMLRQHLSPEGEPFSFVAGISIWPTELIRLAAAGVGMGLLFKAGGDLRHDTDSVVRDFALPAPSTFLSEREASPTGRPFTRDTASGKGPFSRVFGPIDRFLRRLQAICIFGWDDQELLTPGGGGPVQRVDGELLWKRYNVLGRQWYRSMRLLLPAVVYSLAGALLVRALGTPFVPYRGETSRALDLVALMLAVAVFIVLTFYVMDATRLCTRFIDILSRWPTKWPEGTLTCFQEKRNLDADALDEWIDVRFIAQRTKAVGRMIYYPFLLLFLLIVARNHFFDAWTLPISLIVLLSVNAAFALFAAVHLRRRAERARRRSVSRLNEKISRELGAIQDGRTNSNRAEQLRLLVREIETNQEGAFAPLSQQPVVGALSMPFGGAGVLALLELLATY